MASASPFRSTLLAERYAAISRGMAGGKRRSVCYFRCGDSTATRLLWAVKKIAQAQQQAERLVALLRSHGIDPDQIAADL